jgi:hypothetical protein
MNLLFELIKGEKHQIDVLYALLKKRIHTISHRTIPNYEEHVNFVNNNPYRLWFLLRDGEEYIGSVYLTEQNSVGIDVLDLRFAEYLSHIIDKIKNEYKPLDELKSVRPGHFSINVSPSNHQLKSALEEQGCRIAQVTYFL